MEKSKIIQLSLAHLCSDINSGALPATLTFLVAAMGYSYTEVAMVMFVYAIVASAVQPLFGWLADKWQCAAVMPAAVLLMGLSMGAVGFTDAYWQICLLAGLCGTGSALFHPEAARWTNLLSGKSKGSGMSLFAIGGNAGFVLGPVAAGVLIPLFGLHGTAFFAVLGGLAAVLLFLSFSRLSRDMARGASKQDAKDAPSNWKAFCWLFGVVVNRAVFLQCFLSFTALYWMQAFGASASAGSFALAFFSVAGVASNLAGGFLSDRAGYVRVLRITQFLSLPAIFCFVWSPSPWLAGAILAGIAFCIYASFSPIVILGQSYLPRSIGFAAGITMGINRSAGGLAMPVLGFAADQWGLGTAFLLLAVPALAGLVCAFRLPEPEAAR
ncbi:MAG: MFS transporter [Desulfovibrio sp.]|nr:MFS transporter [Desulfovibrio sp.]